MNSTHQYVQPSHSPAVHSSRPQPGLVIAKRLGAYELLEEVARGQSATVFRARDTDGRVVAVKVLAPEVAQNPRRLIRFYQEAKHAMQIAHSNVLQVYEVGEAQGQHFMVMEYIAGRTLAAELNQKGPFSERRALETTIAVARGLAAIHKHGILHRDVGPRNIFLGEDGSIKLGDLEFSKMTAAELELTALGSGLGTPDYMSPEQFRRACEVDQRTDVYGLGATLYVMVTGKLPFCGRDYLEKLTAKLRNKYVPPQQINPNLSDATATIIRQAMMANASRRPPTAKNFKALAKVCLSRLQPVNQAMAHCPTAENASGHWRVVTLTPNGKIARLALTSGQITHLVGQRRLGPDARAACGDDQLYHQLRDIAVFRELFRPTPPRPVQALGKRINELVRDCLVRVGEGLQNWGHIIAASVGSPSQDARPKWQRGL